MSAPLSIANAKEFGPAASALFRGSRPDVPEEWRARAEERDHERADALAQGSAEASVVVDATRAVVAVVFADPSPVGRRVEIRLDPRELGRLGEVVEVVGGAAGGPILALEDVVGVPLATQTATLSPKGFVRVNRTSMVFPRSTPLPDAPSLEPTPRALTRADAPALAVLFDRAYATNSTDRALFVHEVDPIDDSKWGVEALMTGRYGDWLDFASFGWEPDGTLAGATMVQRFHGLLISQVATDPAHRRRGAARALLVRTLAALRPLNEGDPRLVVTDDNPHARRLYERIGFVPTDSGGGWVGAAAFALAKGRRPAPLGAGAPRPPL